MIRLLISDTGPILTLVAIEKFWVLEKLYPQYYLSPVVFTELSFHLASFIRNHDLFFKELKTRVLKIEAGWRNVMDLSAAHDLVELQCMVLAKHLGNTFFLVVYAYEKAKGLRHNIPSFGTISLLRLEKI